MKLWPNKVPEPSAVGAVRSHSWRRFFLLLGGFFAATFLASFIPTPGSWSDVRSQWLDAAAVAVICGFFLITTAITYFSGGPLTRLQASLLCLTLGIVLVFMARELFVSALFLREVQGRSSRSLESSEYHREIKIQFYRASFWPKY